DPLLDDVTQHDDQQHVERSQLRQRAFPGPSHHQPQEPVDHRRSHDYFHLSSYGITHARKATRATSRPSTTSATSPSRPHWAAGDRRASKSTLNASDPEGPRMSTR